MRSRVSLKAVAWIFTAILVFSIQYAYALEFNSCMTLNESTTYTLTSDLSLAGNCINVAADDMIINCDYHKIKGSGSGAGITIDNHINVLIKNCIIQNFSKGILINNSAVGIEYSNIKYSTSGIFIDGDSYISGGYNSLSSNIKNVIFNNNSQSPTLDFQYNWLGSTDEATVNASVVGAINLLPFLIEDTYSDIDSDGVPLVLDNCPMIFNPSQNDTDGDSKGDACDNCINTSNADQTDTLNIGIGDACNLDIDNDTIANMLDNCLFTSNLNQKDNDSDRIGDVCDNCINVSNADQLDSDFNGKGDACDMNIFIGPIIFNPSSELLNEPSELLAQNETGYYVIQYESGYDTQVLNNLTLFGASVKEALKGDAYIIYSPANKAKLKTIAHMIYVDNYHPVYKLSKELYLMYKSGALNNTQTIELELSVFDNIAAVKSLLNASGINIDYRYISGDPLHDQYLYATTTKNKIINIIRVADVQALYTYAPLELENSLAKGITGATYAQNILGLSGRGEIVSVQDTGLDNAVPCDGVNDCDVKNAARLHPDFLDKRLVAAIAYTFGRVSDTNGHGTHVQGTVLGNGAQSLGNKYKGSAPNASLVFLANVGGVSFFQRYQNASQRGAFIHSNSNGRNLAAVYSADDRNVDKYLNSHNKEVAVKSAGNDEGPFNITSPGVAKNIITVGASENVRVGLNYYNGSGLQIIGNNADNKDDKAIFSSQGNASTGRLKPDVVAPGSWIMSTRSRVCFPNENDSKYFPTWRKDVSTIVFRWNVVGGPYRYDVDNTALGIPNYNRPVRAEYNNFIITAAAGTGTPAPTAANLTAIRDIMYDEDLARFNFYNKDNAGTSRDVLDNADCTAWGLPSSVGERQWYTYMGGTSMAAPHVAGLLALMREYLRGQGIAQPPGYLLKALLINGAQDMETTGNVGSSTGYIPNSMEGWGRVNITNSLVPCGKNKCLFLDYADGSEGGRHANLSRIAGAERKSQNYTIRLSHGVRAEFTLAYYDIEGPNLLNDLDMVLISPNGTKYYGGVNSFKDGVSVPNKAKDDKNNVEKLILDAPMDGIYNLSIIAATIQAAPNPQFQTYGLAISGVIGIDSTNITGNYTYIFDDDERIYSKAVGLINNTPIEIVVVAHDAAFKWDRDRQITDINGVSYHPNSKLVNITKINTTENGTLPDRTIVWNISKQTVLDYNGSFNMFVNFMVGHPIIYTNGTDIVDYSEKPGFRVKAVSAINASGKVSNFYPYGATIYHKATGLPNSSNTNVYVKIYNLSFDMSKNFNISHLQSLLELHELTDNLGVIQQIVLLNTSTLNKSEIFAHKGRYNIIVNSNISNTNFNKTDDAIDNRTSYGFSIGAGAIRGSIGNFQDVFVVGTSVWTYAVGLPTGTANIHVMKHKASPWIDKESLNAHVVWTNVTIDNTGIINKWIWTPDKIGQYDVIIDINKNSKYDVSTDVIIGKGGADIGFNVTCEVGREICGAIISSMGNRVYAHNFFDKDKIYADVVLQSARDIALNVYLVNRNSPVEDLENQNLVDVSGGAEILNLVSGDLIDTELDVWAEADVGLYALVIDANNDGKFQKDIDIYDPDGLSVSKKYTSPRIAVDSQGNIHVAALEESATNTSILYAKIPFDADFSLDQRMMNGSIAWSKDEVVNFTVIRSEFVSRRVKYLDIAVDKNNEAHLVYDITVPDSYSSGYHWIKYFKLNSSGGLDVYFDPPTWSPYGNPGDLLVYYFASFYDPDISNPTISVDNSHNPPIPVLSAKVEMMYPDSFYLEEIYPLVYIDYQPIIPVHPLIPMFYVPEIKAVPIVFWGDSIQIARYAYGCSAPGDCDRDGGIQWPMFYNEPAADTDCTNRIYPGCSGCNCLSETDRRFISAWREVTAATSDIALTSAVNDNWHWIPVDEVGLTGSPPSEFRNSKIAVDKDGDVHVVYPRSSDKSASSDTFIYYSKVHEFSRTGTGGVLPTHIPNSYTSDDVQPWIAVDDNNVAHMVWQGTDSGYTIPGIYYARSDTMTAQLVARLNSVMLKAHPTITVDSRNDPIISWLYFDTNNTAHIYYIKGINPGAGSMTTFDNSGCSGADCGIEIVRSDDYYINPNIDDASIASTFRPNDLWSDRIALSFVDVVNEKRRIKVKRTMPKTVIWLDIDGLSNEFLDEHLDSMPNLKALMEQNPTVRSTIDTGSSNTISSITQMFTGKYPKNTKVIGDNFEANSNSYNFISDSATPIDSLNNILGDTIFSYLHNNHYSEAAITSLISKGVGTAPADKIIPIQVDFNSGVIANTDQIENYLQNVDNADGLNSNDIADFVALHILVHDHGLTKTADQYDFAVLDTKIGTIIEALDHEQLFNDTTFMITSGQGLSNVLPANALQISDNWTRGLDTSRLFLNGKMAFYYTGLSFDDTEIVARTLYECYLNLTCSLSGKLDKILIRYAGDYYSYSIDSLDSNNYTMVIENSSIIDNLNYFGSPEIILIARSGSSISDKYYFGPPHKSLSGISSKDGTVPLILTGPGLRYYGGSKINIKGNINAVDVPLVAAYLVGGNKLVKAIEPQIDGKSPFDTQFVVTIASPVHIMIYDDAGRKSGFRNGILYNEIPGSNYEFDEKLETEKLTVTTMSSDYRVELVGYKPGFVHLKFSKSTDNDSYSFSYPEFFVINNSKASANLIQRDFNLKLDYNNNGNIQSIQPESGYTIDKGLDNATVQIIHLDANSTFNIDLSDLGIIIDGKTSNAIDNKSIVILKVYNDSLDSSGFYTAGYYFRIIPDSSIVGSLNSSLTIYYEGDIVSSKNIDEKLFAVYYNNSAVSWNKKAGLLDTDNKYVKLIGIKYSAGYNNYVIASTNKLPTITNFTISPEKTNIPGSPLTVKAKIIDDKSLTGVIVTLTNDTATISTNPLSYNSVSGFYESVISSPGYVGSFLINIIATDNESAISKNSIQFSIDQSPPEITVLSPISQIYTTNHISLRFYTDEFSKNSIKIDDNALTVLNNYSLMSGFVIYDISIDLAGGMHNITIYSNDSLANAGSKSVSFEIAKNNIMLSDIDVPFFSLPGKKFKIKSTVTNTLLEPEESVSLELKINNQSAGNLSLSLNGEESKRVVFISQINSTGYYNITLESLPIDPEPVISDNVVAKQIIITNKIPIMIMHTVIYSDNMTPQNDSELALIKTLLLGLKNPGYEVVEWDLSNGLPALDQLNNFGLVIFTDPVMEYSQIQLMKKYLNNGGYLLVLSDSMGSNMGDDAFYKDYIAAQYLKRSTANIMQGTIDDPIGDGLFFNIASDGEAINPINGSIKILEYFGEGAGFIVKDNNNYKTAYLTLNLSNILDPNIRTLLIKRTLDWFDIDINSPIIISKEPITGFQYPIHTSNVTILLKTDENATCGYSLLSDQNCEDITLFNYTGNIVHSQEFSGLKNGLTYRYYIYCKDKRNNINDNDYLEFYIQNRTYFPPTVNDINDSKIYENDTLILTVNAKDPESDALTFTISDIPYYGYKPIAYKFIIINNSLTLASDYSDSGIYRLRLNVSDGYSTIIKEFGLTIINVNRPPMIPSISPQSLMTKEYYYKDINATDQDNDVLTYYDDSDLFEINPYTGEISFTPRIAGNHSIKITVSDGKYNVSGMVDFIIVRKVERPIIDFIPPRTILQGNTFLYQVKAYDPQNDTLYYSVNTTLFNISSTGLINYTTKREDIGSYSILVNVSNSLLSDSRILNLVITDINKPPIILSVPINLSTSRNRLLRINVSACDPDIDILCIK
ncbi:MAG: S8 family serine peptidase [Candidatus Woesearchaeota archaeon]